MVVVVVVVLIPVFQIQPEKDIVVEFIMNDEHKSGLTAVFYNRFSLHIVPQVRASAGCALHAHGRQGPRRVRPLIV